MRVAVTLSLVLLASGCSVASLDTNAGKPVENSCESNSDCGDGVCDSELHICRATDGQLGSVLFQVTPPPSTKQYNSEYGGVAFVFTKDMASKGGPTDLDLDLVSNVTGTVTPAQGGYATACQTIYGKGNDTSTTAPVKVTFTSTTAFLGLPASQYTAKTSYDPTSRNFQFQAWLPPDDYSVYVEPITDSLGAGCPPPPMLQKLSVTTDQMIPLVIQPSLLHVDVLCPTSAVTADNLTPLDNWTIDIVDPTSGRPLSQSVALGEPQSADPANQHYSADVSYTQLSDNPGKELVRVKPPESGPGSVAPTLVAERGQVELFKQGQALIDTLQKMPIPATVEVQLVDDSGALARNALQPDPNDPHQKLPLTATVRFVSKKLTIDATAGTQAFYETTVDATGAQLSVQLVPGEYDVYVAPPAGSGFATTHAALEVAKPTGPDAPPQAGKTITLETPSDVGGTVFTPGGDPATGANVQALASPVAPTPLEVAVGATQFQPQPSTAAVGSKGEFSFEADPGTIDFSVRPVDGTAFAWLVRPRVDVQPGAHDFGAMTLPLPVVYQGSVLVTGSQLVPGALIRAYVFLNDGGYTADRAGAKSVVQIAETTADANGKYELFLPSHLN